ncbi:tetratricopeptide repeat protein, partial [Streptomyces sp. NPDC097727]|uniref:tetratricopeptide repeat protein n=1 Tax=Streptomyces sp. NPDC097727 TaxID=3366092 RepID=UPI0038186837
RPDQPDHLRTAIKYAGHRRMTTGVHNHGEGPVPIAWYYARALEDAGRVQEAEEVLRESLDTVDLPHHRAAFVGFLNRQGRFDEAVEIGRSTFERFDDGKLLEGTLDVLAENGRPEQALEVLDALNADFVKENVDVVLPRRLQLLGAAGRLEEAITEAAERNSDDYYTDEVLAELLQQDGRVDEAVDVLNLAIRRGRLWAPRGLFELLMRQDQPDNAVAALPSISDLRRMRRGNVDVNTNGGYGDSPPH